MEWWLLLSLLFVSWWLINIIYSIFFSALKDIPSPLIFQVLPLYFEINLALGQSPQVIDYYVKHYGKVFRAGWRLVLFTDNQATLEIYSNYQLPKSSDYDIFSYFGRNLLTLPDRIVHSVRRRKVGPAFTKPSINKMVPIIIEVGVQPLINNMELSLKSNQPINLYNEFHCFAWDIVGKLAFGESFNMLLIGSHPAVKWLDGVLNFGMISLALPFLKWFKSNDGEKLKRFANKVLENYRHRNNNLSEDPSIIRHFASDPNFTDSEVLAEAFIQLFAGTDTTSNTLNWFFYLVLTHPEVEQRLIEELSKFNLMNPKKIITWHEIHTKLPYYEATMKEAMRLMPVVPNTPFRIIPKGGRKVNGYFLPEKTKVAVPIYSLHRHPALWSNPDQFQPDRWLSTTPPISGSFIPFLMGPRACIGKYLAWCELDLVAINLLTRYKFKLLDPHQGLQTIALPTLKPKSLMNQVTLSLYPSPQ